MQNLTDSNLPRITVVTPSYNQGQFLEETIKSVLNQSYPNLEYIIMDGGSKDNSVEIIKKYEKYLTYWQSQPDGGQSAAINAGMKRATGDILCWLNSDDRFTPGCLLKVGEHFAMNPDCKWLAGSGIFITPEGKQVNKIIPRNLDFKSLACWENDWFTQPSVFWRRALWNLAGGLDEKLEYTMDFELILKFAKHTPGHLLSEVLSETTWHKEMKSRKHEAKQVIEACLVLYSLGERELAIRKLEPYVSRLLPIYRMTARYINLKRRICDLFCKRVK